MAESLKINGLKVDAQAIANGLYDMICERGEDRIVSVGMIPKWIVDMLERQLREKLIELVAKQAGRDPADTLFRRSIDENKLKATMAPIVKQVTVGIYTCASNRGKMIV